ncbi:hypothetical protein AJ79_09884 [Helicocarpus griseus UAMH5409]|uniref:Uncharacterized protein n=1 Tax=Helicocarpus griseus UAMH5409 TaxID=1447875 RepID=A0A2B7WGT7_9EURO|nr:hypothetical protein AJ79_09884 [Helicocarpus griseus UAMH5409]
MPTISSTLSPTIPSVAPTVSSSVAPVASSAPSVSAPGAYGVVPTASPTVSPSVSPVIPSSAPSSYSTLRDVNPTDAEQSCTCPPVADSEDAADATPAELPEVDGLDSGLLAKLLPSVLSIINGLGLGGLAPSLLGLLNLESVAPGLNILKTDSMLDDSQLPEINGLSAKQVKKIVSGLMGIAKTLKFDQLQAGQMPEVEGASPDVLKTLLDVVTGLASQLQLQSIFPNLEIPASGSGSPDLLVAHGLLAQLAPLVGQLLNALGLGFLAPLLVTLLKSLSVALILERNFQIAVREWRASPAVLPAPHMCKNPTFPSN